MSTQVRVNVAAGWKKPEERNAGAGPPNSCLEYSSTDILNNPNAPHDPNSNSSAGKSRPTAALPAANSSTNRSRSPYEPATSSSGEYYDAPTSLSNGNGNAAGNTTSATVNNDKAQPSNTNGKTAPNVSAKPPLRPRPTGAAVDAVSRKLSNPNGANQAGQQLPGNAKPSDQTPSETSSYVRRLLQKYETGSEAPATRQNTSDTGRQPLTESGIESDLSHYDDPYRRIMMANSLAGKALPQEPANTVNRELPKPVAEQSAAVTPQSATQQGVSGNHGGVTKANAAPNAHTGASHQSSRSSAVQARRKREMTAAAWRRKRRVPVYNATDTETNIDEYDDSATTLYDTEESDSSGSNCEKHEGFSSPATDYAPPTVAMSSRGSIANSSLSSDSLCTVGSPAASAGVSPNQNQSNGKLNKPAEKTVSPNSQPAKSSPQKVTRSGSMFRDAVDDDDELETFDCSPKSRRRLVETNRIQPLAVSTEGSAQVSPKLKSPVEQNKSLRSPEPAPVLAPEPEPEPEPEPIAEPEAAGAKSTKKRAGQSKGKKKAKGKSQKAADEPVTEDQQVVEPQQAEPAATVAVVERTLQQPAKAESGGPETYVNHEEAARLLAELGGQRPVSSAAPIYANFSVTQAVAPRSHAPSGGHENHELPTYCPLPSSNATVDNARKLSKPGLATTSSSSLLKPFTKSEEAQKASLDANAAPVAASALRTVDVIRLFEQQAATNAPPGPSADAGQKKSSITKSISSTVRRFSVGFGLPAAAAAAKPEGEQQQAEAATADSNLQRGGSRRSSKSKKKNKSTTQLADDDSPDTASVSNMSIDSRSSRKRHSFRLPFRNKNKKPQPAAKPVAPEPVPIPIPIPIANSDELEDSGTLVGDDDSFTDDDEVMHANTVLQQRVQSRATFTEVVPIRTLQAAPALDSVPIATSRSMHNLAVTLSSPPNNAGVLNQNKANFTNVDDTNTNREPMVSTFRRARSEHHIQRDRAPVADSLASVLGENRNRASLRKIPPSFKPPPPPPISPPMAHPMQTQPAVTPTTSPTQPPVIPAVHLLTPGSTVQTVRKTMKLPPPVAAKPRFAPQTQLQPQQAPRPLSSDRQSQPTLRAPLFDDLQDDPHLRFLGHVYVNTTGGGVANWKFSCVDNPVKQRQPPPPLPPPPQPQPSQLSPQPSITTSDRPFVNGAPSRSLSFSTANSTLAAPAPAPGNDADASYEELGAGPSLGVNVGAGAGSALRGSVRRTKRRATANGAPADGGMSLSGSSFSLNEHEVSMHQRLMTSLQRFSASRAPSMSTLASVPDVRALNKDDLESLVVTYLNERKREKIRNVLSALLREDPQSQKITNLMGKYDTEIFELLDAATGGAPQPQSNRTSFMHDDTDASPFEDPAALNASSLTLADRQRANFAFSTMRYSGRFGPPNATYANDHPMNASSRSLNRSRPALSSVSLASTMTLAPANRHHPPAAPSLVAASIAPVDFEEPVVLQGTNEPDEAPPLLGDLPKPIPPSTKRSALFESAAERFVELDRHAIAIAARNDLNTFPLLVGELTRPALDEIERVRAIWRYLTTKDLFMVEIDGESHPDSLLEALRAVKLGVQSLNEIFCKMVHYAGVHCTLIDGYSKGAGFSPGVNIKANRTFRNQWTAVYVSKQWRFCNASWGARYLLRSYKLRSQADAANQQLSQSDAAAVHFPYRCDEFYFLTDPDCHIYEHYPDKKEWTLLKRSASVPFERFVELPILKSNFFNAGLSLVQKDLTDTLETKEGRVRIVISMPRYVGITCSLLQREDMEEVRGVTLARLFSNNECVITSEPPKTGRFFLNVYVSENWRQDAFLARTSGFELGCSFLIRCPEPNAGRLALGRFPPTIGLLGKTPVADRLGLVCAKELTDPYIIWSDRTAVELKLVILPNLKVQHKMTYFDRSGTQMQQCDQFALLQTTDPQRNQAKYIVRCPSEGLYLLTVYAAPVSMTDDVEAGQPAREQELECAWRFLIDARRAIRQAMPFPKQTSRWFGCLLHEPSNRRLSVDSRYLFRISAPHCRTVSAVINSRTWLDLRSVGRGEFEARIQTGSEKGELALYGKVRDDIADRSPVAQRPTNAELLDDDKFVKLLEYEVVDRATASSTASHT